MFKKFTFFLLPFAVIGQIININNGQRRFRQLNLRANELPNDQYADSQIINTQLVNNGYLPPVSSTPPPVIRIASEPSQQHAVVNEDSKINNYLAPPLVNNVKPLPASPFITEPQRPQNGIFIGSTGEPTVESRNYLPPQPEYSPAAQTIQSQAIPLPPKEDDHHHHHHHHHDENFNICEDAFHSFLCAPLKARKRITGAFPESLRGQASFNQYQRALPDRTPAPSNEFLNQYLPPDNQYLPPVGGQPIQFDAPFNQIKPTTLVPRIQTPRTFATTKFVPRTTPPVRTIPTTTYQYKEPVQVIADTSNINDRFYLPPVPEKKKNNFSPRNPELSNAVDNTVNRQSPFSRTSTFPRPEVTPFDSARPSNLNNINSVFPTTRKPFVTTPVSTTFSTLKTTQKFNSPSSFQPSFLSSTTRKTFSETSFAPRASPVPYNSTPKVNNPTPTAFTRSQSTVRVQSSTFNSPENNFSPSFSPQQPQTVLSTINSQFVSSKTPTEPSTNFVSTTSKPLTASTNIRTASSLTPQPSSNDIPTTIKPVTTSRKNALVKAPQLDNTFLPPLPVNEPQVSLSTEQPDRNNLCQDSFNSFLCTSTNSGRIQPQESLKVNDLELKPEPSFQNNVVNTQPSSISPIYSGSSGINDGYDYSKPNKIFPLPSEQKVTITTPTPKLTTSETTEAKTFTGYAYSQPEPAFALPSEVIETADTGYAYPKPDKVFPQPSEQKVVTEAVVAPSSTTLAPTTTTLAPSTKPPASSVTTPRPSSTLASSTSLLAETSNKGYFYPKPQQSFDEKKGYFYPKPDNPLELPIEKESYRPLFSESSTASSTTLDDLGSALFIPVNKLDKRSEPIRTRRYGERLRKLERKSFF